MAYVSSETSITLTEDEKVTLEDALKVIGDIVDNVQWNTDLFVDADSVFACINDAYKRNGKKLPTNIPVWE